MKLNLFYLSIIIMISRITYCEEAPEATQETVQMEEADNGVEREDLGSNEEVLNKMPDPKKVKIK